jgi:hypothetical protein
VAFLASGTVGRVGELVTQANENQITHNEKTIALAVVGLTIVACTTTKQTESVKDQEDLLKERLDTLRQKGYMFGHQDDPFYWAYLGVSE